METNDTRFDYLIEFYGPSATWFAIYVGFTSLFVFISNIFFITLTLSTPSLRKNVANWFLLGFSISDLFHCTAHLADAYALWYGSMINRHLCTVAGLFVVCTATCSFGFPALIAADRYYKICSISESSGFSISKSIFAERKTLQLIIVWFCLSAIFNLPLVLNNAFGEDPAGFCGAKKFTSIPLFLSYEFSIVFVFSCSLTMAVVYYIRLVNYLKRHQAATNSSQRQESIAYTRGIMRVMKIVLLFPLILMCPVAVLTGGQMLLPVTPMWINRLLTVPYFLSSAANPWLTIGLVRQFRVRFREVISNVRNTVKQRVDTVNNSHTTTMVQKY